MHRFILAAAMLAVGGLANAAVYRPSFDGPGLDPTMTFQSYQSGSSYTVSLELIRK